MKLHRYIAFSCAFGHVSAVKFQPLRTDTFSAFTIVERDFNLASFLNSYDTAVKNLTTYVNAFSSGPINGKDFNYAAGFLVGVMDGGRDGIKNAGSVAISSDAIDIVQTVQTDVGILANDLESKKSVFEDISFCSILQTFTSDLVSHSKDLTSTLIANVASEYQDTAKQVTSDINNNYSKAKNAFAGGNCLDRPDSSSSTASITNPTSTSPTSRSQSSQTSSPSQLGGSTQTSHTNNPPTQNPGSVSQNNLSAGAKAGIGIGVSVGVLMFIGGGLGIWLCRRRRQPRGQVASLSQGYPDARVAPPFPDVEDTGKTELGGVEMKPTGSPQVASLITIAPVLLGDAAGGPRWEMDNNPVVSPVWELAAHPCHVYDPGYNQQQQVSQVHILHAQAERRVVTANTPPPHRPHSTLICTTPAA